MKTDTIRNLSHAGDVYISGAATVEGLRELKGRGVQTVIDLRLPEEVEPGYESKVTDLGLAYVHLPMRSDAMSDEQARAFLDTMSKNDSQPVLIECASANRSGAMYGLWLGAAGRCEVETAMERARQAGMRNDRLGEDVRKYLAASKPTAR